MNPNEHQEFSESPKEEIDYSRMTEAEREADFRLKRQEYIKEKMTRKKQVLRIKRDKFGSSSSDSSEQDGPGSRSSNSSVKKVEKKLEQTKIQQTTPKKTQNQNKQQQGQLQAQISPSKKKSQSLDKIQINIPSKKGNEWTKDVLVMGDKIIIIQNTTQQIKKIAKIKIISQYILGSPYKIKINLTNDQEIIFSVISSQNICNLPSYYYVFAKLIQLKLDQGGIKLTEKRQQNATGVPEHIASTSFIYGKIYKKSQVLGNWEERWIVVNKQGIFSYKKINQKHSMFIPNGSITQMWTRFQIQDNLLVIKIFYSSKKTQFGFPLNHLISVNCWLYNFYLMMSKLK